MLPEAFLERMQQMLGKEYTAFLETLEQEKHQALRLNSLKRGLDGINAAERYGSGIVWDFAHLEKVPWAETGYYYQACDQPGKHPFHEAGLYYIQEPSAMAPAELLEAAPGDRVLDLCAAPGGKSTQIAAKLQGGGILFCNEIHSARAKILSENIERMGICNACVTNETPERLAEALAGYFDKILVDAPCSGEGMFRKNGSASEEWSLENVKMCAERQDRILDSAAKLLAPGGRLVYSTCTFAPEENEGSISRFLERHGEFEILPVPKEEMGLTGCDGVPSFWEKPAEGLDRTVRLGPWRIRGEGHFAAVLQKTGHRGEEYCRGDAAGIIKGSAGNQLESFYDFCQQNLCFPSGRYQDSEMLDAVGRKGAGRYMGFGDHLYLVPAGMPDLRGLKVLRPGLHLGERKKGRFEPSHALAQAVAPAYAAHIWQLDSRETDVRAYLNGQTLPAEGEKGWYLVCVDGFGTGWGKLAGSLMKNHYPRGLRQK